MLKIKKDDNIVDGMLYQIISKQHASKYLIDTINCKQILYTLKTNHDFLSVQIPMKPTNIGIYKFKRVKIVNNSDFIRFTTNHCYWYKYHHFSFFKTIPLDSDLLYHRNNNVILEYHPDIEYIDNLAITLNGTHSAAWGHFLIQFLPKLEIAKSYLDINDSNIMILVPDNIDSNCLELIEHIKPSQWQVKKLLTNKLYLIKELFYIDNTSWLTDHAYYCTLGDYILYDIALHILQRTVTSLKRKYLPKEVKPWRKLYLRRDQTKWRYLINLKEIDKLLDEKGYEIITPHHYTIQEKLKIFSEAKVLAGPASSGFHNMIFCQKNTKIIIFQPKYRLCDTYGATLANFFDLDLICLMCDTQHFNDHWQSNFYMDINKVKQALI